MSLFKREKKEGEKQGVESDYNEGKIEMLPRRRKPRS